jgi:hypothetical protein
MLASICTVACDTCNEGGCESGVATRFDPPLADTASYGVIVTIGSDTKHCQFTGNGRVAACDPGLTVFPSDAANSGNTAPPSESAGGVFIADTPDSMRIELFRDDVLLVVQVFNPTYEARGTPGCGGCTLATQALQIAP